MSAKHTPGPWEIDGNKIITVDAGIPICELPIEDEVEWGGPDLIAEIESNARLIAAAPDLLAALQNWLETGSNGDTPARQQARAAVAKAAGA